MSDRGEPRVRVTLDEELSAKVRQLHEHLPGRPPLTNIVESAIRHYLHKHRHEPVFRDLRPRLKIIPCTPSDLKSKNVEDVTNQERNTRVGGKAPNS